RQDTKRIDRVGQPRPIDVDPADVQTGVHGRRDAGQMITVIFVPTGPPLRNITLGLLPRHTRLDGHDPVQHDPLTHLAHSDARHVMHGIKRAAHHADTAAIRHAQVCSRPSPYIRVMNSSRSRNPSAMAPTTIGGTAGSPWEAASSAASIRSSMAKGY